MLSDSDLAELEQAASKAAAPIAKAAADRAMREAGLAPSSNGGDDGGDDEGDGGGEEAAGDDSQSDDAAGGAQGGGATAAAPVKAFIEPEKGGNIECLFNPAELTIAKQNQWSEVKAPGRNAPKLTFSQG